MRRSAFAVFAILAACGGTEVVDGFSAPPSDERAEAGTAADGSAPAEDGSAPAEDGPERDSSAAPDGEPGTTRDASTGDSGRDAAAIEAGAVDSGSSDAGHDPDASPDAAVDGGQDAAPPPPPPPACTEGTYRCGAYQHQLCTGGTWQWQVGDQACCHDARFSVTGSVVTDATTGKHWYRNGGQGAGNAQICGLLIPGGRLPTVAELSALIIGPPVDNKSVCSPTVDQQAFQTVYAGDTTATDGCVDLLRGISKPACSNDVGFLCVSN